MGTRHKKEQESTKRPGKRNPSSVSALSRAAARREPGSRVQRPPGRRAAACRAGERAGVAGAGPEGRPSALRDRGLPLHSVCASLRGGRPRPLFYRSSRAGLAQPPSTPASRCARWPFSVGHRFLITDSSLERGKVSLLGGGGKASRALIQRALSRAPALKSTQACLGCPAEERARFPVRSKSAQGPPPRAGAGSLWSPPR